MNGIVEQTLAGLGAVPADFALRVGEHISAMVYNLTMVGVILTLVKSRGKKSLNLAAMQAEFPAYLRDKCGSAAAQAGGSPTGLPQEWFGAAAHPSYSPLNLNGGVNVGTIDFAAGIARPEQGGGGGPRRRPPPPAIRSEILEILAYYEMTASAAALAFLSEHINAQLACLRTELSAMTGRPTLRKLKTLLKARQFAMFHPAPGI